MTSRTRCECLSLNSVFSIAGETQWGTTSSRQYTTPPFKYCARVRRCSSRGPDRARLHDAMLHEDSFHVFPVREDYRCTPQCVAPHALYENADPFELKEPSGTLRTNNARYEAISDRAVRVSGSEFIRPAIHDQIGRGAPYRIFDDPDGRGARPLLS
jgi:hypothetical protein